MDIQTIISVLGRDGALELETSSETKQPRVSQGEVALEVDLGRLFPSKPSEQRERIVVDDHGIFDDICGSAGSYDGPHEDEEVIVPGEWDDTPEEEEQGIWDTCAWYQPFHFYGKSWGIFIREDCVVRNAFQIARRCDRNLPHHMGRTQFAQAVIRASFAHFYFHEHFHHKVESLGMRMHVMLGKSAYVPYKSNVYRPNFLTNACLEEAMANADAYRRFKTAPYSAILTPAVVEATQRYLKRRFITSPPGYKMASKYFQSRQFQDGLNLLQGQIKEAKLAPVQAASDWEAAPQLTHSLFNFKSNIYTVVRSGAGSVLPIRVLP